MDFIVAALFLTVKLYKMPQTLINVQNVFQVISMMEPKRTVLVLQLNVLQDILMMVLTKNVSVIQDLVLVDFSVMVIRLE